MPKRSRRTRRPSATPRYLPIESHGIVGDLRTVALIGIDGSVDYMCWPRFDSPSVFASLLDATRGGSFVIETGLRGVRHKQMYLPDTNVLLTRFLATDGVLEVSDFMPLGDGDEGTSRLVRRVKAVRGTVDVHVRCAPKFHYGKITPRVAFHGKHSATFIADDAPALRLSSTVPLERGRGAVSARFRLNAGETASFVLDDANAPDATGGAPDPAMITAWFKETLNFWRSWIGAASYNGRWRDVVNRSALALKLLQSRHSGSIVASPTFGLPEEIGGVRNWDYRYTWIRDASFTMRALIRIGLTGETKAFIDWVIARFAEAPEPGQLQTLYALDGSTEVPETELSWLSGYRHSRPVRVGNAASKQLQLDIYGELMDALYLYDRFGEPTSHDLWVRMHELVEWVARNWQRPDEGIWEVRSGQRHFLYSRVMCWVAMDRGIRLAERRSFPAPLARWRRERDAIYNDVFTNFWDDDAKTFVGVRGTNAVDASCLIMPLAGFISPTDPRWLSTLRTIEQRLQADSLIYRYDITGIETDGLEGTEGTFNICSFWYIECLSKSGDVQKARFYFEKMLSYANHLNLFSEQTGPRGEHLGNFPQAFTHLALISAASDLDRRLSRAGWRV